MLISGHNISKSYGSVEALKQLSFSVKEGEIFGFIGPDGAGKTTLFRILTTLLLPDQGEITLAGLDAVRDFRKVRHIVGYMPGRFSLYSDLSVEENLEFFATVFGSTLDANYHLIKDIYVQIEPFKKRLAGRLSGGMKQKLALSCALIHQPKILVLDEPTTGVDAVSRKEFWDLLMGLKARGITILISTPYMDEAGMCDRVALIQKGEIMATDKPAKIVSNYGKRIYSVRAADKYKLLKDLRAYPGTQNVFPFGQDLHYTPGEEKTNTDELKEYLRKCGNRSIEILAIEPGIEDIFMELMQREEAQQKEL